MAGSAVWKSNMSVYILSIILPNLTIKHPYKFIYKDNCEKVGKSLSGIKKNWKYRCSYVKKFDYK